MNIKLEAHQVLLVHSKVPIGYFIQFGMNLQRWLGGNYKPFWKKIYNHSGIGLGDNILAEAIGGGVTIQDANIAYRDMKNREFVAYEIPHENVSIEELNEFVLKYNGIRYQFINFLQWFIYIFTNIWIGKRKEKSEEKFYCHEFVAMILYKLYGIKQFKKYWKISPTEVQDYLNKNCELVY